MKTESFITKNLSDGRLFELRDKFLSDAGIRDRQGAKPYADVSRNLAKLAEDGINARGLVPRENGEKG